MDRPGDRLRFDEFEIDLGARTLAVSGETVHVEPQVMDVLIHLVTNSDRLVSREELLDQVWGDQFVSLAALTTRIKQARQALGDDGRTQRYIRNERGRGYQFLGVIEGGEIGLQSGQARAPSRGGASAAIFGRDDDRRAVAELVDSGQLITVVGPGGVGKTTLASTLISEWAGQGRSTVMVRLDRVRDGAALTPALTTAFGFADVDDDDLARACADWLAATGHVLVLDNCEHVLDPVRRFIVELLEDAPSVRVLATSRQPLGLRSEAVHRLHPLRVPVAGDAEDAESWPCLELFIATARRAGMTRDLDGGEIEQVIELCRRLDGLPLAIELAASRMGAIGLPDLLAGLADRLDWFRNRDVDADERQRSLRSTVDWSFRFLDDGGRDVVAGLAMFPAGLVMDDIGLLADRLGASGSADEIVARLVDASVVVLDHDDDHVRYTMLETIRQFGLDLLAADPSLLAAGEQFLIDHAIECAQAERDYWTGDRDPRQRSLSRLRAELPNLRAARDLMLARGERDGAIRLATGLCAFTEEACLAELWSWHDVTPPDGDLTPELEASVLVLEATAARNRGDIETSRKTAAAAATLTDDRWITGRAKHTEAMASLFMGDPFRAAELWVESDEQLGGCRGRLFAAMASAFGGDLELAASHLAVCDIDEHSAVPVDLFTNVHLVRGEVARIADTGTARAEFEAAVEVASEHGLLYSFGIAQVPLVAIVEAEGDTAAAAAGYEELIELFLRSGTWTQLWTTMRNAARLLADGSPATALLVCTASARDPRAPALDEASEAAVVQLREAAVAELGADEVARIELRASLASRVDVVRETVDALQLLT